MLRLIIKDGSSDIFTIANNLKIYARLPQFLSMFDQITRDKLFIEELWYICIYL